MMRNKSIIETMIEFTGPNTQSALLARFQTGIVFAVFLLAGVLYAQLLKNYHGQTGILPHYNQFIEFFSSGFQRSTSPFPSFPLWGYSLVIFLFHDFYSRALFQTLVHSVVLFSIFIYFQRRIPSTFLQILLLVLLLTPCSFACAPPSQPYSLYADCVIISLLALASSRILASALFFGLALNFRSEAYLLPPAIAVVSTLARALSLRSAIKWLVIIYACMAPWAAYTYYNEGVARITSSNGGAAMITGLGDLPDNKWGIKNVDSDPSIMKLLEKNGAIGISPYSSRADKILKSEYLRLVLSDPSEFWKKITWQFDRIVWQETFPGILWLTDECIAIHCENEPAERAKLAEASGYFRFLMQATEFFTDLDLRITRIGYLSAILIALFGLVTRMPGLYLLNMWLLYSFALFSIGYFLSTYSANLFPVLVVNTVMLAAFAYSCTIAAIAAARSKITG
jgi:hypothetical protein